MVELTKVERENKVYVNEKAIILDRDNITPSELLELAGFSSLVYDCYIAQKEGAGIAEKRKRAKENTKKKINKPLNNNKSINIETGMQFNAILKEQ
ncbi:MAG: hypothetical protein AB7U98_09540 [Candidatus Nitrosocosmicus sp.]|jgi:hypothetical protein